MDADPPAILPASQAARALMVLGVLKAGPRHGYDIHRIMLAHGTLYADFKKPTVYHLLARLADQGAVQVRPEAGARGPRGERLVYALTPAGDALFARQLRALLSAYEDGPGNFQVAAGFLAWLPPAEAGDLLRQRCEAARARSREVEAELGHLLEDAPGEGGAQRMRSRFLAIDHALDRIDADIRWMEKTIRFLNANPGRAVAAAINERRRAAGA
jgi:DNA-binding PadR family transcriptional regulator